MDSARLPPGELQIPWASPEEVSLAIERLTDEQKCGLRRAANRRTQGTLFTSGEEFMRDTLSAAYLAAEGDGGRRWRKDVPFTTFLLMTMRGRACDERRRARRRQRALLRHPDLLVCQASSALDTVVVEEDERHQQRQLQERLAGLGDDPELRCITDGLSQGLTAGQIRALFQLNRRQYDTALKRLWRRREAAKGPSSTRRNGW